MQQGAAALRPERDLGHASSASSGTGAKPSNGEVTVGKPPPDFTTKDHNGADLKLSALKGTPVVIYFYPKDETPGCTTEARLPRRVEALEKKAVPSSASPPTPPSRTRRSRSTTSCRSTS